MRYMMYLDAPDSNQSYFIFGMEMAPKENVCCV